MNVLMVGVDNKALGGMWTVVENYLNDKDFVDYTNLIYIPTETSGTTIKKIRYTAKGMIKVLKTLLLKNIDIVHVHMAERGSVFREGIVVILGKIFRSKVVIHMHGATFEEWFLRQNKFIKQIIKFIINLTDVFIVLGEFWREFFEEIINDNSKIKVLHNAVSIPERRMYNQKSCNIIFLGMIIERKGVYDLLNAINKIRDKIPRSIKVKLYGSDKNCNIEEKIRNYNLSNIVSYCGWLTNENKESCFKDTMINVLPSYNEGLPMTILETMAYGIPNISTSIAGIPEALSNKKDGILIKPGDIDGLESALITLINDSELREKYSVNSYKHVSSKFDISYHIKLLKDIYKNILLERKKDCGISY